MRGEKGQSRNNRNCVISNSGEFPMQPTESFYAPKPNLLLFQWTTTKISHCFRCCCALRAAERREFRGDGETAGCFFAAFNSDISERWSLLHTSRRWP